MAAHGINISYHHVQMLKYIGTVLLHIEEKNNIIGTLKSFHTVVDIISQQFTTSCTNIPLVPLGFGIYPILF